MHDAQTTETFPRKKLPHMKFWSRKPKSLHADLVKWSCSLGDSVKFGTEVWGLVNGAEQNAEVRDAGLVSVAPTDCDKPVSDAQISAQNEGQP